MGFLKGDTTRDDSEITNAYLALRKRLVSEATREYAANTPKMIWKTTALYQCLIRRTLEVADGMRSAWNAGNLLTTITMARSLIETGAVVQRLTDSVKEATKNKDVHALDKAVMNIGFGNRLELIEEKREEYKAQNIITTIDVIDKRKFGDTRPFRTTYDFLSEFVHPNHYGVLLLYSTNLPKEYRIEFGPTELKKKDILPNLRVTLNMVWLVEIAAKDFDKLKPEIFAFVPK